VLEERKNNGYAIWNDTRIFTDFKEMLPLVDAVFIGVPPNVHGEIELKCAQHGVHMFIEKPLHCENPKKVYEILKEVRKNKVIVSVGYMLRYSKAVQFIRSFIEDYNIKIVSINARYNSAYTAIPKPFWWDTRRSGGPIVEQGTHFCDLCRYFGGEIDLDTVQSVSVSALDDAGVLSEVPEGCDVDIPNEYRIPRATQAVWRYSSGAIGILHHAILMKGTSYHTEFEIWADGYRILLSDPYSSNCTVRINDELYKFENDDPYLTEDVVFLNAVLTGNDMMIRSLYEDSAKTYELSYIIRERSVKPNL